MNRSVWTKGRNKSPDCRTHRNQGTYDISAHLAGFRGIDREFCIGRPDMLSMGVLMHQQKIGILEFQAGSLRRDRWDIVEPDNVIDQQASRIRVERRDQFRGVMECVSADIRPPRTDDSTRATAIGEAHEVTVIESAVQGSPRKVGRCEVKIECLGEVTKGQAKSILVAIKW
jgi:hypothetical protein